MRVNIIDADSILYIVTYNKKEAEIKTKQDCITDTDKFLDNLLKITRSTHYLLYLTVGETFRKEINPEYKENRKDRVRPDYFNDVKDHLVIKWKAQYKRGLEADDLCLITREDLNSRGIEAFISTPDKDLLNLEGTHYDYKKNKYSSVTKDEADSYFWSSMITGDAGDNIKGIPGKGEKAVLKLFKGSLISDLPNIVFKEYLSVMGCNEGIEGFYSSYRSLKILDKFKEFEVPLPIEITQYEDKDQEIT